VNFYLGSIAELTILVSYVSGKVRAHEQVGSKW